MANFEIPSTPAYSSILRMLETTDPAHADTFNPMFLQLLENEEYLSQNYLPVSRLANNGVTTASGYGLDARYGKTLTDNYNTLTTNLNGKAPTSHASTATTYGIGSAANFGHVKLSDTYASHVGGVSSGIGSSQAALYSAYMAAVGTVTNQENYISAVRFTKCGRLVIFSGIYTLPSGLTIGKWHIGAAPWTPLQVQDFSCFAAHASYSAYAVGGYINTDKNIYLQVMNTVAAGVEIRISGMYFTNV